MQRKKSRESKRSKAKSVSKQTHPASNPRLQFTTTGSYMPSRFRTSLRFSVAQAAAASVTSATQFFSGNNLFDPGLSSSSNKCPGWTQLAALYNRYRVIGSKIVLRGQIGASAVGGVSSVKGSFAVYPSNLGVALTGFTDASSQPYAKYAEVNSSRPANLTITMATSKIMGQKNVEGSDRTQAIVTTAPAEEWYWAMVFVADVAYTNTEMSWTVQITYDVEFFDRQDLNRSLEKYFEAAYQEKCRLLKAALEHKPSGSTLGVRTLSSVEVDSKESKLSLPESDEDSSHEETVVVRRPTLSNREPKEKQLRTLEPTKR